MFGFVQTAAPRVRFLAVSVPGVRVCSFTPSKVSLQPQRRVLLGYVPQDPCSPNGDVARVTSHPRMEEKSEGAGPVITIVSILLVVGIVVTSFLPLGNVFQNATSGAGDQIVDSLLSRVPLFTVTDGEGRPFMSEREDHRLRSGYFFVDRKDAQKYLERVQADTADAKVLVIGLNEAERFLDAGSTPAKSIPERFDLFPDQHEAEIAEQLTDGAFRKAFGPNGVPIFYIDGLGIQGGKEGDTVYPLFFEKEKLDETVQQLKKSNPQTTIDLSNLQVIDLKQTIREIRSGGNPMLNRVMFVPPLESLEALKKTSPQ